MNRNIPIKHFFNEAGHLTLEALEYFSDKEVPEKIQQHLDHCDLCREALEGFRDSEPGISHAETIRYIRSVLNNSYFSRRRKIPSDRRNWKVPNWTYYLAIAAVMFGLIVYLTHFPGPGEPLPGQLADQSVLPPEEENAIDTTPILSLREPPPPSVPEKKEEDKKERNEKSLPAEMPKDEEAWPEKEESPVRVLSVVENRMPDSAYLATEVLEEMESDFAIMQEPEKQVEALASSEKRMKNAAGAEGRKMAYAMADLEILSSDSIYFFIDKKQWGFPMEEPYESTEEGVRFPGWIYSTSDGFTEYLRLHLSSQEGVKFSGEEKLVISFLLTETGSVQDISLILPESLKEGDALLRLLQDSPDWSPALVHGKPVECRVVCRLNTETIFSR